MLAEVGATRAAPPREVYRQESLRTLFITWILQERGRMRPLMFLASAFRGAEAEEEPADGSGVLPGGRGAAAPPSVKAAAAAVAKGRDGNEPSETFKRKAARRQRPPPGGRMEGNTLVIDIDDPGAMAAYHGNHPAIKRYAQTKGIDVTKARRR